MKQSLKNDLASPHLIFGTIMITLQELSNVETLTIAWRAVRKGKKKVLNRSRGIDKVTLADFGENLEANIKDLSIRLIAGKYSPQEVEIHMIPKAGAPGVFRPIAISTIEDRIVQRALLKLMESYVIKPMNTGVSYCRLSEKFEDPATIKAAMQKLIFHVSHGNFWIFESDIVSFYDKIPKKALWERLTQIVSFEPGVEKIIKSYVFFKIGNPGIYAEKNMTMPPAKLGIAQGSAFSPMLSNIYLIDFDLEMKSRFGDRFIRYVDDFVILCKSKTDADAAEYVASSYISKYGLELAPKICKPPKKPKTKTENLKARQINFLGLSINKDCITFKNGLPAARNLMDELLDKAKYKTPTLEREDDRVLDLAAQINEKIQAWARYYGVYHVNELYESLDKYIHEQTRSGVLKGRIISLTKQIQPAIIDQHKWQELFN